MSDLLDALAPVAEALERLGIRYQIGGSVASSAYGVARTTMDIELVAIVEEPHVATLVEALRGAYYIDAEMIREAIRERPSFNLVHQGAMLKVDVFVSRGRAYDVQSLSRCRQDRLQSEASSRSFPLASPEDVVPSKLEWYELGGRASERQWNDILGVIRVQGEALDMEYLRRWAAELDLAELLDRAIARATT